MATRFGLGRAWMHHEREWRSIGDVRWAVEWWTITDKADEQRRAAVAAGEPWEWEPDTDVLTQRVGFNSLGDARKAARRIVRDGRSFFGCATIQKQVVDWFVEEDHMGEWSDVGEAEEVS